MATRTQLVRWGNSLAVRIPKPIAEAVKLREGDTLELDATADGVRIKPVKHRMTLKEALRQVKADDIPELVDWGPPEGSELW